MNLGLMSTQRKVLALISAVLTSVALAAKDYDNFDLPEKPRAAIPQSRLSYSSPRVQLRGTKVRLKEPSINHQQFVFAKEAYITEKRDEAIKLLRQEMDSNLKANRDNMLLRIGQLYAEKYMELSYREGELYTKQFTDFEKRKATDKNAKPPSVDNSRSQRYLKDALKIFYSLEKEYPNNPKIDEAIFFIGFVELESGNGKKGVAYLERVVSKYPRSRKYEEAVLYLGDYYFDQHKFRDAQKKYRMLAGRKSGLADYASYKLAWCELNVGSAARAMSDMKALVNRLEGTQDNAKFNLREQALKDLVAFYAESERVDDAINFFTEKQGKDKAIENLKVLADIYRSKARDEAAIRAYTRLISEFGDSLEAPRLYLGLFESQARIGKTDAAIKNLMVAIERYGADSDWAKNYPKEKASELKATLETLGSEAEKVAFFHHQAAQRSANKFHYDFALKVYSAILKHFPDHPNRKKIAFYQGEALYTLQRWLDAANSYMVAAQIPPKDKMSDEAAYNALLALDSLTSASGKLARYTKEEQKKVDLTPEDIPAAEKRFIEVAEYYIKEYPQGERVVDVRFRIAGVYYRRRHFDDAQNVFKEIALKHPKHRSATTAAHIVLDIDNIKKNYEALHSNAALFASTQGLGDAEFRKELQQIAGEIDFKQIETYEAKNEWMEAGENYYNFYKKNPSGALAEKALYNAYVSFEKANNISRASETARLFLAKYPKNDYAQKVTLALAKNAERQYDFALAQKLYQEFYKKFPRDKEAKKALYNAAVYAELLELNQLALDHYDEYLKHAHPSPDEKKAIHISQAKIYRKTGNWEKVNFTYRKLMRETRSEDERASYLAELTRQYEKSSKLKEKDAALKELRWQFKGKGVKGLAAQYVAEAEFRAVSPQREKYDAVKLRFPAEDLVYLLKRKQKMLTKLASSYDAVVEVGVPDWGVAALFQKGDAYDSLVRSFRNVQIPKRYKGAEREEVEKGLKAIEAQLVAPLELKAQEIFRACQKRAADFKVANEYATHCQERIKRGENEIAFEPSGLLPQPNYWSTRTVSEEIARK